MASIELDVVTYEGTDALGTAAQLAEGLDLTYAVVTESGPAGGHPVIQFVGKPSVLVTLLTRYCGGDAAEALEIAELALTD